jgi:hypothetical protein
VIGWLVGACLSSQLLFDCALLWLFVVYFSEVSFLQHVLVPESASTLANTLACCYCWPCMPQCFLSFAVDIDDLGSRLQVNVTLVLTAIAFKFVVVEHLPVINYQTYLGGRRCRVMCCCVLYAFVADFPFALTYLHLLRVSDRYILFSLAFMVLIAAENSIVKSVKDRGSDHVAWVLEMVVLVGGGIVWALVHAVILFIYFNPNLLRRPWSSIDVSY